MKQNLYKKLIVLQQQINALKGIITNIVTSTTLTATRIAFGSSANAITSSSNLIFDNTINQLTLLGRQKIGTGTTPYFDVFEAPLLQVSQSQAAGATAMIVKNESATGRAGVIIEGNFQTDSPCYGAILQYSSNFDAAIPWANRLVFQSGGWNKGQTIFVNEGDWEVNIGWDDGSNIDFTKSAIYLSPWWRHDSFSRTRPGGLFGVNTRLPTAQTTIAGGTLGGDTGIDFKRLFDGTAIMPSTITAGEFDAIKFVITGGGTNKNHFHLVDGSTTVFKVNSNFIQIPVHTTTEINAIASPSRGMVLYNSTLEKLCFYNGSGWRQLTDSAM